MLDVLHTTLPQGGALGLAQIFPLNLHPGISPSQTAKVNTGGHPYRHLPQVFGFYLFIPFVVVNNE